MAIPDNQICSLLVQILNEYGVRHAVLSPGTRNAPILFALDSYKDIDCRVVIDERSAAFVALGMSQVVGPVVLCCTSGTALLNYGPAIAEAYYRELPLIIISADRAAEWIDQDDSQTLKQPKVFDNFVKGSYDLPIDIAASHANRILNDAIYKALSGRQGPVHINIQIANPAILPKISSTKISRKLHGYNTSMLPSIAMVNDIANVISSGVRVMLVSGFSKRNNLSESIAKISRCGNVVVACEPTANLHDESFITNVEPTLCYIGDKEDVIPQVLITIGGGLTSRAFKEWLRRLPHIPHYCVKNVDYAVDCYGQDLHHVPCDAAELFNLVAQQLSESSIVTDYQKQWRMASQKGRLHLDSYCNNVPWSALTAMRQIIDKLPDNLHLQLGNGMAVRYAELFNCDKFASVNCNRGVSGIDGSASTAVGFADVAGESSILVIGDMSMQYDISALGLQFIPDNFKIIVLNNGGGGIFKYIQATRDISIGYKWYDEPMNLPLQKLAEAYNFSYYKVESIAELSGAFDEINSSQRAIIDVVTDAADDAEILRNLFKTK